VRRLGEIVTGVRLLSLCAAALAAACSATHDPLRADLESPNPTVQSCAQWYAALDREIDAAGVRDGGAFRIAGFPYLRVDRFTASFRDEAERDPTAFADWLGRLRALDTTARQYELRNLNDGDPTGEGCAERLSRVDLASAAQRETLLARAVAPDDYLDRNRLLGLYPIAALPFSIGVARWQSDTIEAFRHNEAAAEIKRYGPPQRPLAAAQIREIMTRVRRDALGVPLFDRGAKENLLRQFAPVFEIETATADDRIGALAWANGPAPAVDLSRPTVYRRMAFTRDGDQILVQLVYTIWFPARPPNGAFDLLAGKLDGVMFRVTLDQAGNPLVYDSIHPCGCYHMFFPTARVRPKPPPEPGVEWAFAPLALPAVDPSWRIVVRIASRTHYIHGLRFDAGEPGIAYRFAEDDGLRSLPQPGGSWRSAFGPDAIVPGTERGERLLYWPMGIADAGAMRQWGRQATAFLGRRHFDDPDLIERRFAIVAPP
jgi:hypothetical protein